MNEDLPKSSSAFDFSFAGGAKSDNGVTAKLKMKIKQNQQKMKLNEMNQTMK